MNFTHCSLPVQRALSFEKTCFLRTNTDTNLKKKSNTNELLELRRTRYDHD